jgi:hypothetical protein
MTTLGIICATAMLTTEQWKSIASQSSRELAYWGDTQLFISIMHLPVERRSVCLLLNVLSCE